MRRGVVASLFDFRFTNFVTPRVVRGLYAVVTALAAVGALAALVSLTSAGTAGAVLGVVLAPLLFLAYLLLARISLELVLVLFRMGDDLRRLADAMSDPARLADAMSDTARPAGGGSAQPGQAETG